MTAVANKPANDYPLSCRAYPIRGYTVEDLAAGDRLDPLQEAFSAEHALQCGFCTPGFLMLLRGALDADLGVVDDPERLDALLASNRNPASGGQPVDHVAFPSP